MPTEFLAIGFEEASVYGMDASALIDDDWSACQDLAERVKADPQLPNAIVVPSAALPGTDNMVLFGPRVAAPFDAEPIDEVDLPTSHLAEDARTLERLLEIVRFRGTTHKTFDAWASGNTGPLVDLPVETRDHSA